MNTTTQFKVGDGILVNGARAVITRVSDTGSKGFGYDREKIGTFGRKSFWLFPDNFSDVQPDPDGPFAVPESFTCYRSDCAHGSGWNPGAVTTLDKCPNCGGSITKP